MAVDLSKPTSYVYIRSEPGLWTVGFYQPTGKWEPESDHDDPEKAAARVAFLAGGTPADHDRLLRVERLAGELADSVDLMSAMRAYIMNPQAFDGDELKVQLRQAEAKIRKLLAEIGRVTL